MAQSVYHVDPNHSRLRLAVMGSMALGFVLGAVGLPLLLRGLEAGGVPVLLGIVLGILLAAVFAAISERVLQRIWPSGRTLAVTDRGVTLREKNGDEIAVEWAGEVDVTAWAFVIATRRAWVPKGWLCTALRLQQGETVVIPYAFIKPDAARDLPSWRAFEELIPRKQAEEVGEAVFAAQEGLRAAEEERWWIGVEMQGEDFAAVVAAVTRHVPGWPEGVR